LPDVSIAIAWDVFSPALAGLKLCVLLDICPAIQPFDAVAIDHVGTRTAF